MLAFFVGLFFLPLLITQYGHRSLLEAGLAVIAVTVTWTVGNWWQATAVERYTKKLLTGVSSVVLGLGLLATCLVLLGLPLPAAYAAWALGGAAMGIAYPTLYLVAVEAAPKGTETVAVAALMTTYRLGISRGTGVGGAALAIASASTHSIDIGLGVTLAVAAAGGLDAAALTPRM